MADVETMMWCRHEMTSSEVSRDSSKITTGLRGKWSHAERFYIREQCYNACGRSNSEGGRPSRPAAILVRLLQAHVLDGLLFTLASSVIDDDVDAIIDSTGMQSGSASYYYIRTMSLRRDSEGTELRSIRKHIKLTLVIDERTMMILSMSTSSGPGPDFQHFRPTVSKAVDHGAGIATIIGDKGYDSEANRRFVVHELGAEAYIPLRKTHKKAENGQRFYRHRQLRVFDDELYCRRAIVETVNSVIKRVSSTVRSLMRGDFYSAPYLNIIHTFCKAF